MIARAFIVKSLVLWEIHTARIPAMLQQNIKVFESEAAAFEWLNNQNIKFNHNNFPNKPNQ